MRRIDYLIIEARRLGRNEQNADGTYAISDDEVIQYFNDCQDFFQAAISATKNTSKMFVTEEIISCVANQENYSPVGRLYMNKGIEQVEFSASGLVTDYRVLRKMEFFNRNTNTSTEPIGYYRRNGEIYLVGVPSTSAGTLRVLFERQCDDLDKRRGQIDTVNGLTSTTFTSIVLDSTADETSTINLTNIDYICIVDKDGNRKAYNIPVGSYDTGTNTLTPVAGFTFEVAGDSIAVDDYVTFGKFHTTHSQLPDEAESLMINYAAFCLLHKDSSSDKNTQQDKLEELSSLLIKALGSQTSEVQTIPQMNYDDWW